MAQTCLILLVAAGVGVRGEWLPSVHTPLGVAVGKYSARGVERYGGIPFAVPPVGKRRFARSEVNTAPWDGGRLDAQRPGAPCIQNPLGDPRSQYSESPPPTEDCLTLNIYRPVPKEEGRLLPVMVWIFGGGLCGGFAGNEYFNGSNLALEHDVLVVTVSYRLGALGFMVGDDPSRPGSGGMNGIYDVVVALRWLQRYINSFGGDSRDITVFGQSSGGYSLCTLCVAPAAKGLFRRASLLSGPCVGGPPAKGWGPGSLAKGAQISQEILALHNATTFDGLRSVPASELQWPSEWMNDKGKAPYFSGYFEDDGVLPASTEDLWQRGDINPSEIMISFTSKDGTAAFYGNAPVLGHVPPNVPANTPSAYEKAMLDVWGRDAAAILRQYPFASYPSAPSAFIQADADAYVICPSRRLARYAALAGRSVWVSEFAHFQPSPSKPVGCSGWGPHGCKGWGCDNGVELDVVPSEHGQSTRLWASHGASFRYIFGTEAGPDGLGPPNNVTICTFNDEERALSRKMMSFWTSFARYGDPNAGSAASDAWPRVVATAGGDVDVERLRFAVETTDGAAIGLIKGIHDEQCDFWDALYPPSRRGRSSVVV